MYYKNYFFIFFSGPVLQPVHLQLFSTQPEVAYPITENVWMLISFMISCLLQCLNNIKGIKIKKVFNKMLFFTEHFQKIFQAANTMNFVEFCRTAINHALTLTKFFCCSLKFSITTFF